MSSHDELGDGDPVVRESGHTKFTARTQEMRNGTHVEVEQTTRMHQFDRGYRDTMEVPVFEGSEQEAQLLRDVLDGVLADADRGPMGTSEKSLRPNQWALLLELIEDACALTKQGTERHERICELRRDIERQR